MDKRFEFYKDQYYYELTRRNDITSSLAVPIGFLTVLFSGYAYFFLNLIYFNSTILICIFILLLTISLFFGVKALFHLYKSLRGLEYGYVPEPKNLYQYEQEYIKYINAHGISQDLIDEKFFENLKKSMVSTTNKNRENNNFRANRILKANINTIYAIFFLFLATIPFIISKNFYDNNQLKKNIMTAQEQMNYQSSNENPETPLPTEPSFPVDQYVTESHSISLPLSDTTPASVPDSSPSDSEE